MSAAPENQLKPNFQRDKESKLGAEDRGGRSDPTIERNQPSCACGMGSGEQGAKPTKPRGSGWAGIQSMDSPRHSWSYRVWCVAPTKMSLYGCLLLGNHKVGKIRHTPKEPHYRKKWQDSQEIGKWRDRLWEFREPSGHFKWKGRAGFIEAAALGAEGFWCEWSGRRHTVRAVLRGVQGRPRGCKGGKAQSVRGPALGSGSLAPGAQPLPTISGGQNGLFALPGYREFSCCSEVSTGRSLIRRQEGTG